MASENNPTNFYAQQHVKPFLSVLHKYLKKKNIPWNTFLNAIIPPLAAELAKDKTTSPIVELNLGVVDLSK